MAFAIAGLFASAPVTIKDPACAAISFPGFFDTLKAVKS
jgi:5-enolpyruvylshikimate-3-phosphate synthase